MKNFVVIYSEDDWNKKVPMEDSPMTRRAFEDWHERGLKKGVSMYRANLNWFDQKRGVFKKAWAYRNKHWIKSTRPVAPDFILDKLAGKQDYEMFHKKLSLARKTNMLNSPLFRTLLGNKLSQYLCLGDFMPKSFLAMNKEELVSSLKNIETKKVVLKPIHGSGGFGIIITGKAKIKSDSLTLPVLVQEFIEGGRGIPGFSAKNKLADLRIVFIDHNPIYALSRIAKKGSLFTNFHQGAEVVLVPRNSIPQSVKVLFKKIVQRLHVYPKANYSLDFMFDRAGKPYLIEMNTSPGLDLLYIVGTKEIKNNYFSKIIKSLGA
jgi:glutathione synthase/RimK-type ligase-like ATP-grasp enzyme